MNPITIITISCLIASVSCVNFPRSPRNLQPSQSQLAPQALPAPGSPNDVAAKAAAQQAKLHYVEIDPSLKGNYKFGYDTGSGPAGQSFREETRLDDGTVKGAYGYVDANGKQRIVKYTAGKAGFVVEGDQEAPGQGGQAASQPAEPAQQPAEAVRRPQPVNLPQQAAQPQFDDQQPQLNRNAAVAAAPAQPTAEDRARAEQLHAEGLRQHQLATQAALAQQQKLAQQLQQLQQQQIAAAQRQAPQQAPQQPQQQQQQQARQQLFQQQQPQQQQPQFSAAPQPQFGAAPQPQQPAAQPQFAPHPHHHQHQQQQHAAHIVDPQSGSFFSSSNDANLNQLLQNQLRQLQSSNQFAGQQFPQQQHQPQQFAAPQQPATDFNQLRAARQVAQQQPAQQQQQQQFAHHQGLSPVNALATLHQQHQQDAQMLAALRAQQLARLQEQSRQAPRAQFEQPQQQFQAEPRQQAQFAAQPEAQFAPQQPTGHRLPGPQAASFAPQPQSSAAAPTVVAQPENFGPPVIDIRTLNYSIGQQTRV